MKLESILDRIHPLAVRGSRSVEFKGVACDSRKVKPGFLFVAVPGSHRDGGDFVGDASRRGATVIVGQGTESGSVPGGTTLVQVADARRALAEIACCFHGDPSRNLVVAGVTGTNGKTTVSFMLRDFFRAAGWAPGLIGTIRYELGDRKIPAGRTTPEAPEIQSLLAQMIEAGCRSVAMEVSSHALDQDRSWGIDFDAAVFTNLTRDHLDYHQSMENYFAAKARLFEQLGSGAKKAVAIINLDDPWGARLVERVQDRTKIVSYGTNPAARVRAEDVAVTPQGSWFVFRREQTRVRVKLRLMGRFNVSNALAAMTCGAELGLNPESMAQILESMDSVPGRLQPVANDRGVQVFVDYAHTDDALTNVLTTLREFKRGKLLVVFGCGGDRDRAKRSLMGAAAARLADFSILTSDNPRSEDPGRIIEEIAAAFSGRSNFEKVPDRKAAIARALALAREGDTVLIAGKGHETTQEFRRETLSFDDRQVTRTLLSQGGPE